MSHFFSSIAPTEEGIELTCYSVLVAQIKIAKAKLEFSYPNILLSHPPYQTYSQILQSFPRVSPSFHHYHNSLLLDINLFYLKVPNN